MAFEPEIKKYEELKKKYQSLIIDKMNREEYIRYNEVLFSTHSCAIEGNTFSMEDTRAEGKRTEDDSYRQDLVGGFRDAQSL